MTVTIVLPGQLQPLAAGSGSVDVSPEVPTVRGAFAALRALHPAVWDRVFTDQGDVRPHVNIFVGRDDIRWSGGMDMAVTDDAEVVVLPSVSGG